MKKLPMIARILLGLIFFVFGIIGLFDLIPPPPNMPERMMTFMNGMMATGYMMKLIKITVVVSGALLLSNMFVPLALVVLAPVVLNIFLVHAFMAPDGLVLAVVIVALEIYLSLYAEPYRGPIRNLFRKK